GHALPQLIRRAERILIEEILELPNRVVVALALVDAGAGASGQHGEIVEGARVRALRRRRIAGGRPRRGGHGIKLIDQPALDALVNYVLGVLEGGAECGLLKETPRF